MTVDIYDDNDDDDDDDDRLGQLDIRMGVWRRRIVGCTNARS